MIFYIRCFGMIKLYLSIMLCCFSRIDKTSFSLLCIINLNPLFLKGRQYLTNINFIQIFPHTAQIMLLMSKFGNMLERICTYLHSFFSQEFKYLRITKINFITIMLSDIVCSHVLLQHHNLHMTPKLKSKP